MSARRRLVRVRAGLYEVRGVTHRGCGGAVRVERLPGEPADGDETYPPSWECFCARCLRCDPNGYATIRECVAAAPRFWAEGLKKGVDCGSG